MYSLITSSKLLRGPAHAHVRTLVVLHFNPFIAPPSGSKGRSVSGKIESPNSRQSSLPPCPRPPQRGNSSSKQRSATAGLQIKHRVLFKRRPFSHLRGQYNRIESETADHLAKQNQPNRISAHDDCKRPGEDNALHSRTAALVRRVRPATGCRSG